MIKKPFLNALLLFTILFLTAQPVLAQDTAPKGPVYIVQSGDTLNLIAARFGVSVTDLIDANGITDPNVLGAGTPLVIPGLEGVEGKLVTETVPLGQSLNSLGRRYHVPVAMLVKLNKITSPAEIFAGANLIIPQSDNPTIPDRQTLLAAGQSLLEAALVNGETEWAAAARNGYASPWDALPGSPVAFPGKEGETAGSGLPLVNELKIDDLPLAQGKTAVVRLSTQQPLKLSGSLAGRALQFFQPDPAKNDYVALQGMHAMTPPGLVSLELQGQSNNGQRFTFSQMVLLQAGGYVEDPPLYVDPETIDPAYTKPEDDQVKQITAPVTPVRQWSGLFRVPVDEPVCIKSWYGNRRSYNGGDYDYFHTGVDYGVCANLNIYAPAAGTVVFAGAMTVRGNATFIDHGWGVYSAIYHQESIGVKAGDTVEAGQLIGQIGKTGRVTGPHLHWEIWVNGVQVQPLDWLETQYP